MKSLLLITILSLSNLVFGQILSEHKLKYFVNEKEQKVKHLQLSIIVDHDTIVATQKEDLYFFPILDSTKMFNLLISNKKIIFQTSKSKAPILNNGSHIDFGIVTKVDKLQSIAQKNELKPEDEDYDVYSKRYFIFDQDNTIDIEHIEKIKSFEYMFIYPNPRSGCGIYLLQSKVIELR